MVVIATPQLNKQPVPPHITHQVQLVSEIPEPQLEKQTEVVTVPQPVSAPKQGCEVYRAEVAKYDWNINVALAIMKAESGCRTSAQGDNRVIGGIYAPSCGLFQIRTLAGRPSCEQLKDPATNIAWAYKLQQSQTGWRHWSVYKDGSYLKYM